MIYRAFLDTARRETIYTWLSDRRRIEAFIDLRIARERTRPPWVALQGLKFIFDISLQRLATDL